MDNRILAWTLYRIPRLDLHRDDVRRQVSRAYRSILGEVNIDSISPQDCINRFYHRLNEDYQPMHALCRFFLEHCGPMTSNGNHEFIPFVLYMPNLFESFVAEWLRANLPPDISLKSQYWVDLDNENKLSFRIDLVLVESSSDRVLAVLDTKYKRSDKPSQPDIAQIISYAVKMDTKKAFLVYPSYETNTFKFNVKDIMISSLIFDISKDPDEAGQKFLNELKERLKN
jgi:5-methylcytosine-specific restriction enzyme subunit McrC